MTIPFEIDSHKKKILLEGLDDIAQTFNLKIKFLNLKKILQSHLFYDFLNSFFISF